jgi:UPF0716 protein FxsA
MNIFRLLLLAILMLPVIEIFLLVQAGAMLGFIPTLLLIVATGVLGLQLFRSEGLATWNRLQACLARGEMPTREVVEGPLLLLGAILLLTPGFLTDVLGLVCLWPVTRRWLADYMLERGWIRIATPHGFARGFRGDDQRVIDGEFRKDE